MRVSSSFGRPLVLALLALAVFSSGAVGESGGSPPGDTNPPPSATTPSSKEVRVRVGATRRHDVSPLLYGAFFEEISLAGEGGGLYSELLANRDFESLGIGPSVGGSSTKQPGSFHPWQPARSTIKAQLNVSASDAPYDTNPNSLGITLMKAGAGTAGASKPGAASGSGSTEGWVVNRGWGKGFAIRNWVTYELSAWVKVTNPGQQGGGGGGGGGVRFVARLLCPDYGSDLYVIADDVSSGSGAGAGGEKGVNEGWVHYKTTLQPPETLHCLNGGSLLLGFVATSSGAAAAATSSQPAQVVVRLDGVSLTPSDAVAGLFRLDLFDRVKALKPAVLRFPGGNYLEGKSRGGRWDWKKTVGLPKEARPGHYNDAWKYWVTDGLGLYEYLLLSEALGAEPMMSVYTGYIIGTNATNGVYDVSAADADDIVQDALDALEFANGDVESTKWGAVRAQMGHPEPFNMRRLEIGNEESNNAEYAEHYRKFTAAVWAKDKEVQITASGRWQWVHDYEGHPCYGVRGTPKLRCDLVDEHYYLTATQQLLSFHRYDSYPRLGGAGAEAGGGTGGDKGGGAPHVYVGEHAAWAPARTPDELNTTGTSLKVPGSAPDGPSLHQALADAANVMGFERNADVVKMSSFAPLLAATYLKTNNWRYNLINFDEGSGHFVIPTYHVLKMMVDAAGDFTLNTEVDGAKEREAANAMEAAALAKSLTGDVSPDATAEEAGAFKAEAAALAAKEKATTPRLAATPELVREMSQGLPGMGGNGVDAHVATYSRDRSAASVKLVNYGAVSVRVTLDLSALYSAAVKAREEEKEAAAAAAAERAKLVYGGGLPAGQQAEATGLGKGESSEGGGGGGGGGGGRLGASLLDSVSGGDARARAAAVVAAASTDPSVEAKATNDANAPTAKVLTSAEGMDAANTLYAPHTVEPADLAVECAGRGGRGEGGGNSGWSCAEAVVVLPPWSFAVVDVPVTLPEPKGNKEENPTRTQVAALGDSLPPSLFILPKRAAGASLALTVVASITLFAAAGATTVTTRRIIRARERFATHHMERERTPLLPQRVFGSL